MTHSNNVLAIDTKTVHQADPDDEWSALCGLEEAPLVEDLRAPLAASWRPCAGCLELLED